MPREGRGNPQARSWFFVINDHAALERVDEILTHCGEPLSDFKYGKWQFEVGERERRLHIGGYVQCVRPMRRTKLQAIFGTQCWCDPVKNEQAVDAYNCKEDTRVAGPFEYGHRTSQGERTDITTAHAALMRHRSMRSLAVEHTVPFVRHTRAWDRVLALFPPPNTGRRRVVVYWGVPGAGKSYAAKQRMLAEYAEIDCIRVTVGNHGVWFDGADNPKAIFLDDFRGRDSMPVALFKELTDPDGPTVQVDTKHGRTWVSPELIVITSESDPTSWYDEREWDGLQRRIFECRWFPQARAPEPRLDTRTGWNRAPAPAPTHVIILTSDEE